MPPRLEVGRIDRAHGLRGEVVVTLVTNRVERVAPGAVLYAHERPLEVVRSSPMKERFVVQFAGVDSREAADALHGLVLSADPIDDPGELWVHDLIGALVVDQNGVERGRVTTIEANPASDLLVTDAGALVPARFIVSVQANERVEVDVPEGLFE